MIGRAIAEPKIKLSKIGLLSTQLKQSRTFGPIETFAFACLFDREERDLATGVGWRGTTTENSAHRLVYLFYCYISPWE